MPRKELEDLQLQIVRGPPAVGPVYRLDLAVQRSCKDELLPPLFFPLLPRFFEVPERQYWGVVIGFTRLGSCCLATLPGRFAPPLADATQGDGLVALRELVKDKTKD